MSNSLRPALCASALLACALIHGATAQDLARLPAVELRFASPGNELIEVPDDGVQPAGWVAQPVAPALGSQPFSSDDRQRLDSLESQLAEMAKAEAERSRTTYPTMDIEGRIHLDATFFNDEDQFIRDLESETLNGTDPENAFYFRRIRLGVEGQVAENILYCYQIDFNTPDSAEIKDVYLGLTELPVLGTLLIGNQKRPYGLDHLNSSNDNIFLERPEVVDSFNEDARRLGMCAYDFSADEVYNWRYGVYLLEAEARDGKVIGDSAQGSFNARLAASPWYDKTSDGRGYLHLAVSSMYARPDGDVAAVDTNDNEAQFRTRMGLRSQERWLDTGTITGASDFEIVGLETIVNIGALQFTGEYMGNWLQRDDALVGAPQEDLFFHGGYFYASYLLTGEHIPLNRREGRIGSVRPFENFFLVDRCRGGRASGWGAWLVAFRYSYLDLTDADILGGIGTSYSAALIWYWDRRTSIQTNYVWGNVRERDQDGPGGVFAPGGGDFDGLAIRFRIFW